MTGNQEGLDALSSIGRSEAAGQLDEAWKCISRRPKPDIKGAAYHAMAALEATDRDVNGQPKLTLRKLVRHLELKPPLDKASEKLWAMRLTKRGRSPKTSKSSRFLELGHLKLQQ